MIIRWEGGKNFTVKTKALTAKIGDKNELGELLITGPGEYEIQGVQIEFTDGIIEVFAEGIVVGHIQKGKILSDTDLEKLNGIDVLLIGVGGGNYTETKTALQVISQIEPSIVIPMYEKNLEEFTKEEGVSEEGQDEIKIAKADLSEEERRVIVLKPTS